MKKSLRPMAGPPSKVPRLFAPRSVPLTGIAGARYRVRSRINDPLAAAGTGLEASSGETCSRRLPNARGSRRTRPASAPNSLRDAPSPLRAEAGHMALSLLLATFRRYTNYVPA
ncbi:hypothetical protein MRX96_021500 [Rhipicephalus microplus]